MATTLSKTRVPITLLTFSVLLAVLSFAGNTSPFVIKERRLRRGPLLFVSPSQEQQGASSGEGNGDGEVAEQQLKVAVSSTGEAGGVVAPFQKVSEMPPFLPTNLKNRYYLLRHGQSTANVAEIISSSRSLAYTSKHGLTDLGYQQGKQSASHLLDALESTACQPGDQVVFISSPFARAYQTSLACLDGLDELDGRVKEMGLDISKDVVMNDNLVERYFGRLDGEAIYTYAYVWPLDKFDTTHNAFEVESVAAVATRLKQLVDELEKEYEGCHLVWVSHADVLQIAQLYGAAADNVGLFSSYRFKNGEVRPMLIGTQSHLPPPVPLEAPQRGTYEYTLLTQ